MGMTYIEGEVIIPESVKSLDRCVFMGCERITSIIIKNTGTTTIRSRCFTNLGSMVEKSRVLFCGSLTANDSEVFINSPHEYFVKGNFNYFMGSSIGGRLESFRIGGNFTVSGDYVFYAGSGNTSNINFIEMCGDVSISGRMYYANQNNSIGGNTHFHFGSSSVALAASKIYLSNTRIKKVLVGSGISSANDEAVLALYLADTDWSAYSSNLATWYDYNGEYKWYYVTDVLTNCTNTNPDDWPHVTRGEEYRTTIVANAGYTLDSVTVEMYFARDNSPTPDEPTDITESAYNASTGEIYIEVVSGNVVITASAS